MRPHLPTLLAAALGLHVACAPPPKISGADTQSGVDGAPSIRFIFPETSQTARYCSAFMVAVDVDNFELYPDPYEEGLELVDGQGHWHLNIPSGLGGGVVVGSEEYVFIDLSAEDPDPEARYIFEAELVDNLHVPLPGVPASVAEIIIDDEYMVEGDTGMVPGCLGGASGATCSY